MRLAIYGSGGLGRELMDVAVRRNRLYSDWTEVCFVDDFQEKKMINGHKCIQYSTLLKEKSDFVVVVGVGEPMVRERLFDKLLASKVVIATLVDPTAQVSPTVQLGAGTVVCEYSIIHANALVPENCLIQPFVGIAHDAKIGRHCVLSSFCVIGGCSSFGQRVFAGMHSSIKEKVSIGDDVIIAMGSSVFQSLPGGVTVVGNPARITRGREDRKVF